MGITAYNRGSRVNLPGLQVDLTTPVRGNVVSYDGSAWTNTTKAYYETRDYDTWAAAIASIGATKATLVISENIAVSATVSVPANVILEFSNGAELQIATGVVLTINSDTSRYPKRKIFDCAGTGSVSFGTRAVKEVYPEWWGAIGDGPAYTAVIGSATDCSDAIIAAIASVTGVPIYFGGGVYTTTECIYLSHSTHLRFSKESKILGYHTDHAVISLKGATQCVLENPYVMGSSQVTPKTGIALGRTATDSAQENTFYRPNVEGWFSVAAIYSIAAELLTMYSPRVNLLGGGAKYCWFTSDTDDLSVDSFTAGSNTMVSVYSPDFVNEQTGNTDDAVIYVGMATATVFGHSYPMAYLAAKKGSYVQINCDYDTGSRFTPGPISFDNCRGEGLTTGNAVYLSTTLTSDVTMQAISFIKSYFIGPLTYFVYSTDYVLVKDCIFESVETYGVSVYKANGVRFSNYANSNIVVRSTYSPTLNTFWKGNALIQLTDDSATPTVMGGNLFYSQNTNPTTITNFANGVEGQIIHILFYNTYATIATTNDIKLEKPFSSVNTASLTLLFNGSRWYELGRQVLPTFRSGAGDPTGAITPAYAGEEYLNTTGNHWYKAHGATSSDWSALN
jgi:hypothetical protein